MATKLGFKRFLAMILAAAGLAAGDTATAGGNWMPLLPDQNFYDFQLFAPPDLHEYSVRRSPREGIFFTYDRTYWALTVPPSKAILNEFFIPVQPLSPFSVAQLNNDLISAGYPASGLYIFGSDPLRLDLNTNWMRTDMSWGNRFEGGWCYDDYGMLFSYYDSGEQSQGFQSVNQFAVSSPTTTFNQTIAAGDATLGGVANVVVVTTITSESPPPDHQITQTLDQVNSTELRSGGFAWIVRRNLSRAGSGAANSMRFSLGPKFLQVADRYSLTYNSYQQAFPVGGGFGGGGIAGGGAGGGGADGLPGTGITPLPGGGGIDTINAQPGQVFGTPLQNGGWDVSSYNNIVGPEIGFNYQVEQGRWVFESDFRFVAGMNWQNTLYRGSNFPAALGADYFRSTYTFANTISQAGTSAGNVSAPPLFVQIYGVGQQNTTNTAEHNFVFSPLGEWRFRARYRMSQAISLNLGYTGMWLGGITRASTNTEFRETRRPVITATQNGPPIPSPVLNSSGQPTGETIPVASWTPPPINAPGTGNNQLRVYNQVGPSPGNDLSYLFVNGIDFGIEVNY
jgi:hypothetical protein